jgi:hypothetical protein
MPEPATTTVTRTASVAISGFRINTALSLGSFLVTHTHERPTNGNDHYELH